MMQQRSFDRIVFYSANDMVSGTSLMNAVVLLDNFDGEKLRDINDHLELYNIQQYFEHGVYLVKWSEAERNDYFEKSKSKQDYVKKYFLDLQQDDLDNIIATLDYSYREDFWYLFGLYQIYRKVSGEVITRILTNNPSHIEALLQVKNVVKQYNTELRRFLLDYEVAAELILKNSELLTDGQEEVLYHMPTSLTGDDIEFIVENYLDLDEPNLNYVLLVKHSKDSDLKLNAKIRLKAQKKVKELNKRILEDGVTWKEELSVTLNKEQEEPVLYFSEGQVLKISYSINYLDNISKEGNSALFYLFKTLFQFTNTHGLINLVNRDAEMTDLEKLFLHSKNEYVKGWAFMRKERISVIQLITLDHYLANKEKSIEVIIKDYVEEILCNAFGLEGLEFYVPTANATFRERLRILAPDLEALLKQYQLFTSEGEIDHELFTFSSKPLHFSENKSLLGKKYVYILGIELMDLKNLFFSKQSLLSYVEPFEKKYDNLYDLLLKEDIKTEYFKGYQIDIVNRLISEGYLIIEEGGLIKIANKYLFAVLRQFFYWGVVSYWHQNAEIREQLEELALNGLVEFSDQLFTRHEIDYFNFYLNKKEFTNGLDLRNRYAHGTNRNIEAENKSEYFVLLKIIILVLLKITDDLTLGKRVANEYFGKDK